LGLILGTSLILHRKVKTDGKLTAILPQLSIIIIPLILGINGLYSRIDGLIMIGAYFLLIYYLYRVNSPTNKIAFATLDKNQILKAIFFAIIGTVAVLLVSNLIVRVASDIIAIFHINELAVGLLFFAIGTNLPEISITFTSWRKKTAELSLSHLLSSAFTNILVLGILSAMYPISITTGIHYFLLTLFIIVIIGLFAIFYKTEKKLDQNEGLALVFCYAFFIVANIWALTQ
jgi:cation:H+ antiporter